VLFHSLQIRNILFPNRIVVSPMCQYSSTDGFATDWHLVHLGSRAVGGAALVFTEATAIVPIGRISPQDLGIWKDEHIEMLARIVRFLHSQGAIAGIQLAHAGRKGSTARPWEGGKETPESKGGWIPVAPSAVRFAPDYPLPMELDLKQIRETVQAFADAARRACDAGFDVIEIHAAHGYLLHEFLSPLSNFRFDDYGHSFENRTRIVRETVTGIRKVIPEGMPLFIRISATDWIEGGWDLDQSIALAGQIGPLGVDLIDCSSGGITPAANAKIQAGPNYQVPFSAEIRSQTGIPTGAIGMITSAAQADTILREGRADVIEMAREFLREPYWPLHVAHQEGFPASWPAQYLRAAPQGTPPREPLGSPVAGAEKGQKRAATSERST
jgi:2,4-dienoyl-CoA reductase-like NADH-dependent reductase (Old Yellow Enzyme family)